MSTGPSAVDVPWLVGTFSWHKITEPHPKMQKWQKNDAMAW